MIRKHFGVLALALTTVLGLGAARVLYAQTQDQRGTMGRMSMMQDCPMMHGMAEGPGAALEHRDALALSEEQVAELEAIEKRTAESRRAVMERMREIHREIHAATEGERFDEATARATFDRVGNLHTEMGLTVLRARHEARAILTAERREKLADLGAQGTGMHGMMGGMHGMMGMMNDCPMMMKNGIGGMRMDGAGGSHERPHDGQEVAR